MLVSFENDPFLCLVIWHFSSTTAGIINIDWDVNAKLPHGVEDVRRHLEEVDNVPLLVSLYTDATKNTAAEMVRAL